MTKIKICGITNTLDAQEAVKYGADALGFVFAKSPRRVTIAQTKRIIKSTPVFIAKVGVFVNEKKDTVLKILNACRLDALQFHGDESDKYCAFFQKYCKIIKAFRIKDKDSFKTVFSYKHADAYLFDTFKESLYGGTGEPFSYRSLKSFKFDKPVIIAGGINPENAGNIFKIMTPYAVDVSSGIEKKPGKKDLLRMESVIKQIKNTAENPAARGLYVTKKR